MGARIEQFDLVAFDADDTLWESEDHFQATEARFAEIVSPHAPSGVDVLDALHAIERVDIASQGYGVKAFTLSMIRAAISISDGTVPTSVLDELLRIGSELLTAPVHLLPDVPEVLATIGATSRLALITKGDLVHQTRKVETSGLAHHFAEIEIVLEKDPAQYDRLLRRFGVSPDRFLMVGNSVRSDVLPVLALGGHAVHVPYHLTWELEHVDDHDEDVVTLDRLADLPTWLGL